MTKERRTGEVRSVTDDGRTLTARVMAYNVVDDYGTRFVPGCFNKSLELRLPKLAWAHDWSEPIGRAISYADSPEGLDLTFRLSDPDAVPRARQAIAQLRDGDITDVSVGFLRTKDGKADDGVVEIREGELDETSLVLRGAVPGAKVLAVRVAGGTVDLDAVVEIARKKAAGDISDAEAQAAVALLSVGPEDDEPEPDPVEDDEMVPVADVGEDALQAEIDAALSLVE